MTDRSPQADADVIRRALGFQDLRPTCHNRLNGQPCRNCDGHDALDRLIALLAEKDAEIERLKRRCTFPKCVDGEQPEWCGSCGDASRAEASAAQVRTLTEALRAAARLADIPNVESFTTYECEHGATLGRCEDDEGKIECSTQDDMALVHAALASLQQPPAEEQT